MSTIVAHAESAAQENSVFPGIDRSFGFDIISD
jgi:hypothetical protein